MTSTGFVMAMRGDLVIQPRASAEKSLCLGSTWFLASRSGPGGRLLLIGWTGQTRQGTQDLAPRRSLVAMMDERQAEEEEVRFTLLRACPQGIAMAGRMQPAEGFAHLSRLADRHVLRVEAGLPGGQRCRIEATQQPWIGEVDDEA